MSKPKLSVSFHNFWSGFDPDSSFFMRALRQRFDARVAATGRDVQFFGVFGSEFSQGVVKSDALKVFFSGEISDPRHIIYDLHFSFTANPLLPGRSFRFPVWILYVDWWSSNGTLSERRLTEPRRFEPRPNFCNFIYSNPMSFRAEVFDRLNRLRPVDSLGGVLNTAGRRVGDKMAALATYQFTLAFENAVRPGYVTEKLLEPLAAGSIPIYWGPDEAKADFNPDTFIDADAFGDLDALLAHVLKVAADRDAVAALAEPPVFRDGIPPHFRPEFLVDRIEEALATPGLRAIGRDINERMIAPTTLRQDIRRLRRTAKSHAHRLGRLAARVIERG